MPSVALKNGTDEYSELVPEDVSEAISRLDIIDAELMNGAIAERFVPKQRLQQLLPEATALYSFFVSRHMKWKAILDNREVEAYMESKRATERGGSKFVSAAAEREAANAVKAVRYLVGVYEGNVKRTEQYVNTAKKLLESMVGDEKKA